MRALSLTLLGLLACDGASADDLAALRADLEALSADSAEADSSTQAEVAALQAANADP